MAGLTLGVGLLIVVLSVMNGFDKEMRDRILGLVPHVSIIGFEPIEDWPAIAAQAEKHPAVMATAPFIHLQGMLLKSGKVEATLIQGILPEREDGVSVLAQYMRGIALEALSAEQIVLGKDLAAVMDIKVGDSVSFVMPQAGRSGQVVPKLSRFNVAGIFDSGTEVDRRMAVIHIDSAARLRGLDNAVQGVRLALKDLYSAPRVSAEVLVNLPYTYFGRDWTDTHGNLFEAIQLSKKLVVLLLFIIVAVAAFNVVSTLILVVTDKQADIAILRTLGISPRTVMAIFMVQGTVIGVMGTLFGAILGMSLSLTISDLVVFIEELFSIQFLKSDVYPVSQLPSDLRGFDVLVVCSVAIGMSFLATLFPSWRATKVQPAEALRYEM